MTGFFGKPTHFKDINDADYYDLFLHSNLQIKSSGS